MKTSNLDSTFKEKLQNRTLQPSDSAWERLAVQLEEQPKKIKKTWLFYSSIAAAILLLISFGLNFSLSKEEKIKPTQEVVIQPIDTSQLNKTIDKKIEENQPNTMLVQQTQRNKTVPKSTNKKEHQIEETIENPIAEHLVFESLNNNNIETVQNQKSVVKSTSSSIKIDSEDLLYAVTHSLKEVQTYYAKYQLNRDDVLQFIKKELKTTNIEINPTIILAEVERTIDEEDFQNNFMKSLKKRVIDIAQTIASRND